MWDIYYSKQIMGAKDIILKPINSKLANSFVKKHHYSGKVVNNSQLHFGVYYNSILWGVMSYWPSTIKAKLIWLVDWTKRNEFIELNRMAFSDILPKYSESRAIAISIKLLKKNAPHIKRIVSFADGCQCWDWTIYRASGFDLTQIKENHSMVLLNWEIVHAKTLWDRGITTSFASSESYLQKARDKWYECEFIKWYMLRYIKLLKPNLKINYERLPYSKIKEVWASMYKGEKK